MSVGLAFVGSGWFNGFRKSWERVVNDIFFFEGGVDKVGWRECVCVCYLSWMEEIEGINDDELEKQLEVEKMNGNDNDDWFAFLKRASRIVFEE